MKSQTKTWFIRKSVLFLSTTVNGNKLLGAIILFRKVFTEEDKNNSIKYMKQLLFNFPLDYKTKEGQLWKKFKS